jgi:hypothetical protein
MEGVQSGNVGFSASGDRGVYDSQRPPCRQSHFRRTSMVQRDDPPTVDRASDVSHPRAIDWDHPWASKPAPYQFDDGLSILCLCAHPCCAPLQLRRMLYVASSCSLSRHRRAQSTGGSAGSWRVKQSLFSCIPSPSLATHSSSHHDRPRRPRPLQRSPLS